MLHDEQLKKKHRKKGPFRACQKWRKEEKAAKFLCLFKTDIDEEKRETVVSVIEETGLEKNLLKRSLFLLP